MQYMKIENPGISSSEAFTLLGASSTRYSGHSDTIGQFGSGSKHAVNLFLRQGISPIIFCGNLRMEFFTKPQVVNGHCFSRVCVRLSGKDGDKTVNRTEVLGWVVENGELDWRDMSMACREFVSNAIDGSIIHHGSFNVNIALVEEKQVRAKAEYTRVFLPHTQEVAKFYFEIPRRFLHFSEGVKDRILSKTTPRHITSTNGPVIYRKGVYVREFKRATVPSLFDYNFSQELTIDEARNSNESDIYSAIGIVLKSAPTELKKLIITALIDGRDYWEFHLLSKWDLECPSSEDKIAWKDTWEKFVPKTHVLCPLGLEEVLRNKGYIPVIAQPGFYSLLKTCGVPCYHNVLSNDEQDGLDILPPSETIINCFSQVWQKLEALNFTRKKEKPELKMFRQIKTDNTTKLGFYKPGTVYINCEQGGVNLKQTVLEELTHHITEANDCSRSFQEFFMQIICENVL